jgi:hypothetical protein
VRADLLPTELVRIAVNQYNREKKRESRARQRAELAAVGIFPRKPGRPRRNWVPVVCTSVPDGQEAARQSA